MGSRSWRYPANVADFQQALARAERYKEDRMLAPLARKIPLLLGALWIAEIFAAFETPCFMRPSANL